MSYLRINYSRGLSAYLAGIEPEWKSLVHSLGDCLDVLFGGEIPPNPVALLSGDEGHVLVEHNFLSPSPFFDQVVFELKPKDMRSCWLSRSGMLSGRMISFGTGRELKNKNCRLQQVNILSFTEYHGKEVQRGRAYNCLLLLRKESCH